MTDEDTGTKDYNPSQTRFRERAWPGTSGLVVAATSAHAWTLGPAVPTAVRGGESEGGVHLRCGQGQRPFLGIGDAPGVAVG
jgi:hypothetical protein